MSLPARGWSRCPKPAGCASILAAASERRAPSTWQVRVTSFFR
jgi:hypothetical protein